MKKNKSQFPTCDNCGREIRGKVLSVRTKSADQTFHPDHHGCSEASRPPKKDSK